MKLNWRFRYYYKQIKRAWREVIYCNKYYMCFTEEMIMNDRFPGYRAGRLETRNGYLSPFSIEEQRIFTKDFDEFYNEFLKYMWKETTEKKLEENLKLFEKYDCGAIIHKRYVE